MAIQMTRAEYQAKYGNLPTSKPIQMTRAEYNAKYGQPQQKSLGGFLGNVVNSGIKAVGDIGSSLLNIVNPNMEKNTVANLVKLGRSIIETAIPGEQGNEEMARQVGKYYADRYGGLDKAWNSFYQDPVGVAMDVSTVIGAGAGVANLSGKSGLAKNLTKVATVTDPLAFTASQISKPLSKISKLDPNEIYFRGIGNPQKLAKAEEAAKAFGYNSLMDFAEKYGLGNRDPQQLSDLIETLGKNYDEIALKGDKYGSVSRITAGIDDEISKLIKSGELQSDAGQLKLSELQKRRNMIEGRFGKQGMSSQIPPAIQSQDLYYQNVRTGEVRKIPNNLKASFYNADNYGSPQGKDWHITAGLTPDKIQRSGLKIGREADFSLLSEISPSIQSPLSDIVGFRRTAIDPDIPKGTYDMMSTPSAKSGSIKKVRDIIRSEINRTSPELKSIGGDINVAEKLQPIFQGFENRGKARQLLNFSKLGSAGIGGLIKGVPGVVGGFITEQIANNPRFLSFAAKGAKKSSKIFSPIKKATKSVYGAGKAGRLMDSGINQSTREEKLNQPLQKIPSYTNSITQPVKPIKEKQNINWRLPKLR